MAIVLGGALTATAEQLPRRRQRCSELREHVASAMGGTRRETSVCQREAVEPAVAFRMLGRTELSRVVEIDRTERIDVLYDQHGSQLVTRHGNWSAPAWDLDGH